MPVTRSEQASELVSAEAATLQAVLLEIRQLRQERDEQARREAELRAKLQQHEDELIRLQRNQISQSVVRACGDSGSCLTEESVRAECGFKLKPDTYDGSTPLQEFFAQFNLIASANRWSDSIKTIALASCLRGKARSVLETVQNLDNLDSLRN